MDELFFFAPETLGKLAEEYGMTFRTGRPFPHVVLDGFLPDDYLEAVARESSEIREREGWIRRNDTKVKKVAVRDDWTLGPMTRHLLNQFNSATFINFLEELTGISGLIPDPHYLGGGLHQIERGGFLKIHADFNRHERLKLDRRINALLYLNRPWHDTWGGHLELWDSTMTTRADKIAPLFNRLVIFTTTDSSLHGHPDPLDCPPDTVRRSLALYYYTNGRPEHEQSAPHSTLHQPRPGEVFGDTSTGLGLRKMWKKLAPRFERPLHEH
ncbi:MAG TPA: 2OG-Fe(II) oxygenase [Acidimicrobiales bacterium]|nr:2OG-Fe(II) oxygenase [Acidimicrobiales bacterium]